MVWANKRDTIMTKNQREFQKELARLERSISRLTKQHKFVQSAELPAQPKKVTRKRIKQLQELKGRHFVSEIDVETGEIIHGATYEDIYKSKPRKRTTYQRPYDPEKARAYREAHREQIAEANKRYRESHKEQIRERQRAYRQSHKEEIREKTRVYRQANKQRINASARRRRRQKKLEQQRIPPTTSAFSIYDELMFIFTEAKREAIMYHSAYLEVKIQTYNDLIGTLQHNRDELGEGEYSVYLKRKHSEIAQAVSDYNKASDQTNVEFYTSYLRELINPANIPMSLDTANAYSTMTERGTW